MSANYSLQRPGFDQLRDELVSTYGPVVSGSTLVRLLGFPSASAFRQARVRNKVGVSVFALPGRRGSFALTSDIAAWIALHSAGGSSRACDDQRGANSTAPCSSTNQDAACNRD